jgi:hypothetical protein
MLIFVEGASIHTARTHWSAIGRWWIRRKIKYAITKGKRGMLMTNIVLDKKLVSAVGSLARNNAYWFRLVAYDYTELKLLTMLFDSIGMGHIPLLISNEREHVDYLGIAHIFISNKFVQSGKQITYNSAKDVLNNLTPHATFGSGQ